MKSEKCFIKMMDGKAKNIPVDADGNCTICGGYSYVDENGFSHVWYGHRKTSPVPQR